MYSTFIDMGYARTRYKTNARTVVAAPLILYGMSLEPIFFKVGLSWVIFGKNSSYHGIDAASSSA